MHDWILILLLFFSSASGHMLYRAIYTPVPGTDPEYAQGAIERNELAHREIEHFVWLIDVTDREPAEVWQQRLNAAVSREHGAFRVIDATDADRSGLESGRITLQK